MAIIIALLTIGVLLQFGGVAFAQLPVNSAECGVYNAAFTPDQDIVDSVHARPNEFPWQVQIEDIFGERVCSAMILDDTWLLATASCVEQFPVNYIIPYAILERAYYRPTDWTPYRRTVIIEKVIHHPHYDATSFAHDFALIKLHEKLDLEKWKLQPACLPYPDDCDAFCVANTRAYYVGWGRRTLTIQKAPVKILSNEDCDSSLQDLGDGEIFRGDTQICAAGCLDMCWFASGSSLSVFENDTHQFFLCGLGSHVVNQPLCTALGPFDSNRQCSIKATTQAPTTSGATGPILPLGYGMFREGGPAKNGRFWRRRRSVSLKPETPPLPSNTYGPSGIFSYICPSLEWIDNRANL